MKAADRIRAFIDARAQQTPVSDIYLDIWVENERFTLDRALLEEMLHDYREQCDDNIGCGVGLRELNKHCNTLKAERDATLADLAHLREQASAQLEVCAADLEAASNAANIQLVARLRKELANETAEKQRYIETIVSIYTKLGIRQEDVEGTELVSDTIKRYVDKVVDQWESTVGLEVEVLNLREKVTKLQFNLDTSNSEATHSKARAKTFEMVLREAVECGMVPVSSTVEGGSSKYARQVEVADSIRALLGEPLPPDFAYMQRSRLVRLVDEALTRGRDSRPLHPREAQEMVDEFFGKEPV